MEMYYGKPKYRGKNKAENKAYFLKNWKRHFISLKEAESFVKCYFEYDPKKLRNL